MSPCCPHSRFDIIRRDKITAPQQRQSLRTALDRHPCTRAQTKNRIRVGARHMIDLDNIFFQGTGDIDLPHLILQVNNRFHIHHRLKIFHRAPMFLTLQNAHLI